MKIAVIVPARSEALFDRNSSEVFGGGNIQMYQIAKELGTTEGVDCYTFIEDYSTIDFAEANKFNLIKTYRKTDSALVKFWKYHKVLQEVRPDVILQHGLTLYSSLLAVYCRFFRIRFVFMFAHDNEAEGKYQESRKKSPIFRWLLNNSSLLITQNQFQKQELMKRYDRKSQIIRNGFYLKPQREFDGDYVLWVARHCSWKRPELFIDMARGNPHIPFKMVCPTSRASGYEQLKEEAKRVENLEFIEFVPFDEIDAYFEKAKVFVNTSEYEGFPQTFIQAAMNSLPVLSLNVDPDNILSEYRFGFCGANDLHELNEKLNLLCSDDALYREMSTNAFHYAEQNHDIKKNVKQILESAKCVN